MTKTTAAKKTVPPKTPAVIEPVAGAATPVDPPVLTPMAKLGATEVTLTRIEQAWALPEVGAAVETLAISIPEGAIAAFKSRDRRTLRVVMTAAGLAAQE